MYSDLQDYYLRWYHDRPVAINARRKEELHQLHRVMYKCITCLVEHYEEFVPEYMPLSPREMDILKEQSRYPFSAGTYRPDYIISDKGQILLCEITSRFFAHGIFISWFGEQAIKRFLANFGARPYHSAFADMMDYMMEITRGQKRMFVFKSADKTSEIKLYKRFYEAHGIEVEVLEAHQVEERIDDWASDAFLVSALNQKDLLSFSDKTLEAMMAAGMYSDFRNIFLIHDKRFLALWFEDDFTSRCLDHDETVFLREHTIPSFLKIPDDALANKDKYILKPQRLGKSEGILPGFHTSEQEWRERIVHDGGDMIAQPFISQLTIPTVWEGKQYDEYLCGMMLCVDDRYFDTGFFRCSSFPITNMADDRKACALYSDDPELLAHCDIL